MPTTTPVEESIVRTGVFEELPVVKESTTSRVLVNNDVLRHVMFSMDAGQVLTEHAQARAVIVNLLTGVMDFTVGDEKHTLKAGDVIYLAPGERHAVEAIEPCYMSLTLVAVDEDPLQ